MSRGLRTTILKTKMEKTTMDNNKNLGWFVWFEVKINELAMSVKAGLMIVFLALLIQVASVILLWIFDFIHFHNEANSFAVIKLFFQNFPQDLFGNGELYVLLRALSEKAVGSIFDDLFKAFMYSSPILVVTSFVLYRYINGKTAIFGKSEFMRGAKLIEEIEQIKRTKNIEHNFKLGAIPIPKSVETSHLMVIGSAGSGKTQILA